MQPFSVYDITTQVGTIKYINTNNCQSKYVKGNKGVHFMHTICLSVSQIVHSQVAIEIM